MYGNFRVRTNLFIFSHIIYDFRSRGGHQHSQDTRAWSRGRRRTSDNQMDTEGRRSSGCRLRRRRQQDIRAPTLARRQLATTCDLDAQTGGVRALLRDCRTGGQNIFGRPETPKTRRKITTILLSLLHWKDFPPYPLPINKLLLFYRYFIFQPATQYDIVVHVSLYYYYYCYYYVC